LSARSDAGCRRLLGDAPGSRFALASPGPRALGSLALLCLLDQRGRDDQRAALRDDQAVARELVARARDRLAAGADHVGELLLGRAAADDQAVRRLGALL